MIIHEKKVELIFDKIIQEWIGRELTINLVATFILKWGQNYNFLISIYNLICLYDIWLKIIKFLIVSEVTL